MPQHPLAGGQEHVGGDESAGLGIVVPGPQVVQLGLLVVDVAPVAEGVQRAQCGCQGARTAELLAPAVIRVFYYGSPGPVNQLDNVPLAVAQVVIVRPVVVHRCRIASGVVAEPQRVVPLDEPDQHFPVVVVVCNDVVDRLLQPQSILVVAVGDYVRSVSDPCQLLPAPGQSLAPVGRGVPHGVVGDRLSVVAGQLIIPFPGGLDVRDRACGRAWILRRGVGIDALLRQVPPAVVGVRHRLIREPVVLTDQLVGSVVFIGNGGRPSGDRGYVPVVVVSVGIGVVAAVLYTDSRAGGRLACQLSRRPSPRHLKPAFPWPLPLFFSGLMPSPRHVQSL